MGKTLVDNSIFSRKLDRSNIFCDSRYMFYEIFDIMKSCLIISGPTPAYFATVNNIFIRPGISNGLILLRPPKCH